MINNIQPKESNQWFGCIMIQLIATSYSFFLIRDMYNLEFIASMGFWINFSFYLICKVRYIKQKQDIELIQINSQNIDLSLLLICNIFIIPLFIYSYITSIDSIQQLSLSSLFSVFSFFTCSIFTYLKNKTVKSTLLNMSNSFFSKTLLVLYCIYGTLLIVSFVYINYQLNSHSKFIFSYFTLTLLFMGVFRIFNFHTLGQNFQATLSITVFVISWNKVDSNKEEQVVLNAYTFLLFISLAFLIYLANKFRQYLFKYPPTQVLSELPVSNQQENNVENNNTNNQDNSIILSTGQAFQNYLQQLQRLIDDKESQIMKNITIEQYENVLQATPYSHPQKSTSDNNSNSQQQDQEEQDCCSICQLNFENGQKIFQLNCNHNYHTECLSDWLKHKNTCPLCRNSVLTTDQMTQAVDFNIQSTQIQQVTSN